MEFQVSFVVGGQALYGLLYLPDAPRPPSGHPSVVLLHGYTGNRAGDHRLLPLLARRLSNLGVAALTFDFRGSGESQGDFAEMTVSRELEDVRAAFAFARAHPELDAKRVMLLGFSMGGMVAALAAAEVNAERLVLWAPASPELWLANMPTVDTLPEVIDVNGWPLGRAFLEELPIVNPVGTLTRFSGRVRVVHGEVDAAVPLAVGQAYAEASNAELVVIPGANHTFDSLEAVRALYEATASFLTQS
ncbi:alpha/beta hydrolase family protein [Deinococcus yavapaiensis]|uniref:alpha/beta hydrolase family protein n=1 Tax=Deinococcus yavapaiensis TaxID=309889 RepID=UPI000DA1781C|nr:alpha/beta fold hydrolase [Deinococcus yavapaiensis]